MNLTYQLIRSDRRTIGITVERDRRVVVRAPLRARAETIHAAVERKRFWIWQKLQDPRKRVVSPQLKEIVSGESFLFLGQSRPLNLIKSDVEEFHFAGDHFKLSLASRRHARSIIRDWYQAAAKTHIVPRVAVLAKSLGLQFKRISVRDLRYRWGSCTPRGSLIFNWRIVQAPPVVIDYIVVHELAHLLEQNHSPAFWNIVAVQVPSWKKARNWLKVNGGRLEW